MKKEVFIFIGGSIINSWNVAQAQEKPNFLFILTDDQTYQSINSLNNKEVSTPNLDRLVKNGTVFTHAFNQGSWTGAVSVASRTMLITGQNVVNSQRNSAYIVNWARTVPLEEGTEVALWGDVMGKAGYKTFITGKWHNTDAPLLKSFQKGETIAEGFYETYDPEGKSDFGYNRPNDKGWNAGDTNLKGHWSPAVRNIVNENGDKKLTSKYTVEKHTSELFADKAIDFLQEKHTQPFFMYVAFNAPHDPRQSPEEVIFQYEGKNIKIPANFLPDHPFDINVQGERDENLASYPRTKEAIQLHRKEYYAIITHMDREIGRILDAVEEQGYNENTYIIFTSDQGLAVGMHGLMGKQNLYEHSIRVPLIITGPSIEKGKKIKEMVYMQSVYPTTCELAGIEIPSSVDFQSLAPCLQGEKGEEYIFGYFRHIHRMIRSKSYKLIVYPESKHIQLFDLRKDPYEVVNLANNPKYKKIKEQLFSVLQQKQQEMGDTVKLHKEDYF